MADISIPAEPTNQSPSNESPDDSPEASTSSAAFSCKAPQSGKAPKEKPRRACEPCRLRRVRCERVSGSNDCIKCQALNINCVETVAKQRSTTKGARIAQAKLLYGDADGQSGISPVLDGAAPPQASTALSFHPIVSKTFLSPGSTAVRLSDGRDAAKFLSHLIPELATFRVAKYPLLRWCDIPGPFQDPDFDFYTLSPLDQALYLTLGALAARGSNAPFLIGHGAPTLQQVSQTPQLRQGTSLCQYGERRERLCSDILQAAIQKLHSAGVFSATDLRSVVALTVAEMLLLVYRDPLAFSRRASTEARPFASGAATHLRILAEDHITDQMAPTGWYSVAWTLIIRDSFVSSAVGRALDFTSSDLFLILKINEQATIPIPSGAEIAADWPDHLPEGPKFMQLWARVLQMARQFVLEISQPLAIAQPRLKLEYFDNFYTDLTKCRESLNEAIRLAEAKQSGQPAIAQVLAYNLSFLLAQAYRIITWRAQPEQLDKANTSGINTSYESYRTRLYALKAVAEVEAFQCSRRVLETITGMLEFSSKDTAEWFLPGYQVLEGLLLWASLLLETDTDEKGGRLGYPAATKAKDLRILREAVSFTGWSSGNAATHLHTLDNAIAQLEARPKQIEPAYASIPSVDAVLFELPPSESTSHGFSSSSQQSQIAEASSAPNLQFGAAFEPQNLPPDENNTDWLDAFLASNPFPWPAETSSEAMFGNSNGLNGPSEPKDQPASTFDPTFFGFAPDAGNS